ncbi:hypothetical protein PL81_20180 [Streptomyces sp. RSD-27]|nr:hypothetical protein PL81_20180 [Streptomyces sp. RSD-27]
MVRRMQITNAADRIAARLETKRARRPWNADLHPRDSKGRFIETGGIARLWGGGMARVLRSLGGRQVLVENLSSHERSNVHASRLTMVARPDGTAPTRSKKKVRDEDERRQADGRRGTGRDAEDAGDQGDTPDDPHGQDDEGDGIGDDVEGEDHGAGPEPEDDEPETEKPAPKRERRDPKRRFKTLEDVRAHWADGRVRAFTENQKAQEAHNKQMAELIDKLDKPQLSRNGHFVVGHMTFQKDGEDVSGWAVIHTDTGLRLTTADRKAEATDFANRMESAQLDGKPIDWNDPASFDQLNSPEGRAMGGRIAHEAREAFSQRAAKKREGATARTKPATAASPEQQAAQDVAARTGAPARNVAVGHVGPKQATGDERGRPRNSEELREFWKRGGAHATAGEDAEKTQADALRRMAADPKLRIHLASHHGFAIVEDTSRNDDWRFTVMTAGSGRRLSGLGPHRLGRYGNFPDQETADRFALYLGSNLRDGDGRTLDWGSPDLAKELASFRDKDGQPSNVAIWLLAGQFDRERGMNDSQAARFGRRTPADGAEDRDGTRNSAGAAAPSDDVTPQQAAGQPRNNQEEQGERVQGAGEGVLDDVPAAGTGRAGGDDAAGDVLRADQRGDRGADRGVPGRLPGGDGSGDGLPGGDGQREHGDDAGAGEGAARDGVQPGEGAGHRGSGDAEGEPAEDRSRVGFGSREQEQTAPQFQPPEDGRSLVPSGVAARVKANIAAIEVLRRLETENRPATAAEQETLARWSGWGATPQVFVPNPKPEFEPLQKKLRALLTDEEWEAAEGNTLNAHYTDPSMVQAVWKAVRELGFDGGNVLEPGSGSGNFIGHAPEGAHMTGVELDPITAGIAKALYPQADIRNEGFEKTRAADGTFDLAIGNVPFGDYQVVDLRHNKGGHNIHNHFILKSLDLTRPGGLVAVVTSRYTMDGSTPRAEDARMEMARKADLVGAIRLPTGAHRRTAGTDVVTDLLIFRRREKDKEYTSGRLRTGQVKPPEQRKKDDPPVWVHSVKVEDLPGQPDDEAEKLLAPDVHVNPYFLDNPQNVLGEMEVGHGMYGPGELRVVGDGDLDASLDKALKKAVTRAKASGLSYAPETGERRKVELLPEGSDRVDGHVEVAPDGTFTQVRDGMIRPYDVPSTQAEEARQLLGLRDSFKALVAEEGRADADEQLIETLRGDLKARYDKYHAKFGSLNRFEWAKRKSTDPETGAAVEKAYRKRPPMGGLLTKDPTMAILLSLDSFDANTGTSTPAAIFSKRQAKHRSIAERASSPEDAMAIVMEQHPTLNGEALGKVMGLSPEAAREKLLAARSVDPDTGDEYPLVFEPHNGGDLIPAADYLSGNVRKRLEEAQALAGEDARFEINVKQLEAVLPPDISPGEIDAPMGASWLGAGPVQQFLRERLNTNLVTVSYQGGSLWKVDAPDSIKKGRVAQQVWGVPGFNAVKLAETILTNGRIRVTYQDESGKTYLDEEATAAAQTKADEMREEFQDWLWATPERSDAIKRAYNYTHNNLALRSYDGQRRTMPGLAEWFKPHPHQHAAVARMVNEPAVLLAHEVGAGKTAEMTMGVMELRRLGLINKAAMVVPNHMLQQFTDEFAELYPESAANGRILAASSEDLQGRKRREFIARVATGDYDAVILTQNAFESIPMRPEVQLEYIKREAKALKRALERQKEQDQADKPGVRSESRMVKEIQKRLRNLEAKIEAKIAASKDTAGLYFEDTGIDYVVVDEAHHYKNLSTNSGIPGAGIEGSNRASDLDMKLEFLRKNTKSGRVVTFATATPISNSVTEAHTMLRYLRPDLLEAARVRDFDEFASTYGKIVSGVELAADGSGFKEVSRFAAFRNMPELLRIWKTVADVKNSDDLAEYLDTPDVASGKAITISVEPTEQMLAYQDQLAARARAVKGGDVDPRVDNMLKISSDGRKVSLDPRMVGLDEKGLKLSTAADNIRRIYEDTKDAVYPTSKNNPTPHATPGGLQIVFLDMGTPKDPGKTKKKGKKGDSPASLDELAESPFPAYQELKELLVERGVPADKVRFIHEAKNDAEKARLFHDARTGKIAVLVGSTAKMGTGTNVQLRATALHHLDCPWRPADLEQRNGRIIRQGNMNPEVAIFQYVTEQSFDGFSWQTVARKAKFIRQLMKGNLTDRTVEDIPDGVFNAEQVTAISTGNPHLLEQANVKASLAILKRKLKGHERTIEGYKSTIQATERLSKATDQLVAQLQDVVKRKKNTRGDDFNATIGNTDFTKRDEASKALATAALAVLRQGQNDPRDSRPPTVIGRVGGIEVTAKYRMAWDNTGRVHLVDISIPDVPQSRHSYTETDLRTESNLRITRLEDSLADVEKKIVRAESHLRQEERAAATARERVDRPFEQAAELEAAERRSKLVGALIREQSRQVGSPEAGKEKAARLEQLEHQLREARIAAGEDSGDIDDPAATQDTDLLPRTPAPPSISTDDKGRTRILWPDAEAKKAAKEREKREKVQRAREERGETVLDPKQVSSDLAALREEEQAAPDVEQPDPEAGQAAPDVDKPEPDVDQQTSMEPQADSNTLVDLHTELGTVDSAETRLHKTGIETWGTGDRVPDGMKLIRRAVLDAVAAMNDGEYDTTERRLIDARESIDLLRGTLDDDEQAVEARLHELADAIDAYLPRHRKERGSLPEPASSSEAADGGEDADEVTLDPKRVRADLDALGGDGAENSGETNAPSPDTVDGTSAPDEGEKQPSTADTDTDTTERPQAEGSPAPRSGEQPAPAQAPADVPERAADFPAKDEHVITPDGPGEVMAVNEDSGSVLVRAERGTRSHALKDVTRPDGSSFTGTDDQSSKERQNAEALAQAATPEGLKLSTGNRLRDLDLDAGHGTIVDENDQTIGWVRARIGDDGRRYWWGQDADGGAPADMQWHEEMPAQAGAPAVRAAGIVRDGLDFLHDKYTGRDDENGKPEKEQRKLRTPDRAITEMTLTPAQVRELSKLTLSGAYADGTPIDTLPWDEGHRRYSPYSAQAGAIAAAARSAAAEQDESTPEGRRNKKVLLGAARRMEFQEYDSARRAATIPPPGQPDNYAAPYQPRPEEDENAEAQDLTSAGSEPSTQPAAAHPEAPGNAELAVEDSEVLDPEHVSEGDYVRVETQNTAGNAVTREGFLLATPKRVTASRDTKRIKAWRLYVGKEGEQPSARNAVTILLDEKVERLPAPEAEPAHEDDTTQHTNTLGWKGPDEQREKVADHDGKPLEVGELHVRHKQAERIVYLDGQPIGVLQDARGSWSAYLFDGGHVGTGFFAYHGDGWDDGRYAPNDPTRDAALAIAAAHEGEPPKIRSLFSDRQVPQQEAERIKESHLDPRLARRWSVTDPHRGRASVSVDNNWAGEIRGKRDHWQIVGEDGKPSGPVYPTPEAAAQAIARNSPLLDVTPSPDFHVPLYPREVSEARLNNAIDSSERWLRDHAPDLPDNAHSPIFVRRYVEAMRRHRQERDEIRARDAERLGGPERIRTLVARAELQPFDKPNDPDHEEFLVKVDGETVGNVHQFGGFWQANRTGIRGDTNFYDRDQAIAHLVAAHDGDLDENNDLDTPAQREAETSTNQGDRNEDQGTHDSRDRDRNAEGGGSGEPPLGGTELAPDAGDDENPDSENNEQDGGAQEDRRERRRRRRDRDSGRGKPEGPGGPSGGLPPVPHLPDGDDRNSNGDGGGSSESAVEPGRLKALLARYRSGDVPAPPGADPQRHAEYLRGLASNDSLTLSPGGGLVTWTNSDDNGTWRFAHAASGLHLEGWEADGAAIGGREGARRLAGAYERMRGEDGQPIDWTAAQVDGQALREWRDEHGDPLGTAIERARQDAAESNPHRGDGSTATPGGKPAFEDAGAREADGEPAAPDTNREELPPAGAAAGSEPDSTTADQEGDGTPQSPRQPEGAGVSRYTINAYNGTGPQRSGVVDGHRVPTAEELTQYETGESRVLSEEGERALFGSPERMEQLASEGFVPTPVMRSDEDGEVWRDGRMIGSLFGTHLHSTSEKPEEVWWSKPPLGSVNSTHFRSREAAIAHLVLRDMERGEPDLSVVHPDLAFSLRHTGTDLGFPAERNPFRGLETLPNNPEDLERYGALRGLLADLGRGATPSGNVADDLGHLHDELRWLDSTHYRHQQPNLKDRYILGPRWLADQISEYLDVLRPEDPRARHHTASKNRAARQFIAERLADGGMRDAERVSAGDLHEGDLVYLSGRITGLYAGATSRKTGFVIAGPKRATFTSGGVKHKAWRITISPDPYEGARDLLDGYTFLIPVEEGPVPRLAQAEDVDLPFDAQRYGRQVGETPHPSQASDSGITADAPPSGNAARDVADGPEPVESTGQVAAAGPAEPTARRAPSVGDSDAAAGPDAEEATGRAGSDETASTNGRGQDGAGDEPAPAPETDAAPEPVDGRPAEWVKVSDLGLSDLVRIEGITKTGTPRTLAGYVVDGPKEIATVRARRVQGMYRVLIAETPDGRGKRESVWVMPDATAARATRDDDRVQGAPETGAEADIRAGRISERVPTDRSGQGLFPGSVVTDANGREGVVTGASANGARVQFGDDRTDDAHSPTSLNVTDGGAARPSGWTADGHLVRPGNVVGDRDGNLLGTVEDVDGDTATVATPQGMEDRPATDLRVLGGVQDVDNGQPAKVGRLERVPVTDINEGDSIVVDGPDGMTTVEVTGKEEVSPTHTRITAADTTTGELHSLDGGADATYMRALDDQGRPVHLGPEDAPNSQGEITSREPAPAVDPVDGPTVEPQLSPEERDAIADRGEGPTDSPDAQQAAARIANDLPVTAEQATALAEELRDGADTATPEGRAAQRAADHLDAAAGNEVEEAGTPEPGTVGTVGVGDTIALPGEFDRNTMTAYRVVQIQDVPGGVRVLTIEDEDGMRFKRSLPSSDPLYQLPEAQAPTDGPDAEPRDPNPGPDADQLLAAYSDAVVRAVIDSAIEGTNTPGSIHQLREQIAQQLTPESLRTPMRQARNGALAAITDTGAEGDQHDNLVRSLRPEASRARTDAIRAALRTVDDLEPLDGESEEDTARRAADLLRLIPEALRSRPDSDPDDGQSPVDEAVTQHADDAVGEALQAAASGGPLTDERRAAIVAQLAERMAATRAATAERIAANVPAGRRPGVLARIMAGLVLLAQKLIALIAAFLKALAKLWRSGKVGLRRVRDRISRFRRGLMQRVRSWPETRRLRRLAAAAELPEHADGLPLGDRVAHWARLLPAPGRFGQVSRRARWYRPTTRSSLAAGQLPPVQDGVRWTADRAVDGGPGPQALRHLAALRAAGQDVDQDVVARLAAAAPELGDDPHGTVRHAADHAESAERRLRDLEAAAAGGAPDADLEIAAARVEAQSARQEAARLQQSYAAALPGAVRDSIAEVREVGPGTTASLVTTPDSDPGAVRVLTDVSQFIPRDWLSPTEARFIGARSGDAGGYDPDSRIATVADLGDGGRRAAAHALLAHLQQHYPDLLAAQEAFHFTRTHSGRTGARRRTGLDALLARLFRGRTERGGTGDVVPLGLGTLFSGNWYEDDDLRAFLLGLLATR